MTFRLGFVALSFCGLNACAGRALDLDQVAPDSPAAAVSDPGLPASLENIKGVWVDDQRLYWLAAGVLQSCRKADCKQTTLTYATAVYVAVAVVADRHVYWRSPSPSQVFSSCPTEGCSPNPVTIVQDDEAWGTVLSANGAYFYWSSAVDIYRCPATGCAATPEVVASNASAEYLLFDQTHAYWQDGGGIVRAPVDGSEAPKPLTPLAEYSSALAVGGGYLYWTAGKQVFRCAIASCDTSPPTLLATADSFIYELKLDDTAMYWLAADSSIHSCPLTGCEQARVLTPPLVVSPDAAASERSFAIDASDVYWIDGGGDPGPTRNPTEGKAIRRTAK